jgi:hypothetical protein
MDPATGCCPPYTRPVSADDDGFVAIGFAAFVLLKAHPVTRVEAKRYSGIKEAMHVIEEARR